MPANGRSGDGAPESALFHMSKQALARMAETRFRSELESMAPDDMTRFMHERELTPSQQKIVKFYVIDARNQKSIGAVARSGATNPRSKKATSAAPGDDTPFWRGFTDWFSNITPGALIKRRTKSTAGDRQRRANKALSKGLRHRVPIQTQIEICEMLFGPHHILPGGAARIRALSEPLMLTEGINGLDLSAGVGGMQDALYDKSGLFLTLMEWNPNVAAVAMAQMAARPEAEQRDIVAYNPAALVLGPQKYDWAVSREMLFHVSDKLGFLKTLQQSMYNGGQIILTDLALPDDSDPMDKDLLLWRDAESQPIYPITVSQYRTLLEDANMEVLDFENDTAACASDIRQAWSNYTTAMQTQSIDAAFQQHILHEAEYWHSRLRAFESGALRLLRIRAVHRAAAKQ